jgi:monovalent cation:H+ antiporter-2, CPA2 family
VDPVERWVRQRSRLAELLERPAGALSELPTHVDEEGLRDHVVVIGYGRVGAPVAEELAIHGVPHVVVEQTRERAEALRQRGLPVIYGDATRPEVLAEAHLERARLIVVAAPDAFQTRAILALARRLNPTVDVIMRTHSDDERVFLEANGAERALVGERELAVSLTRHALRRFGVAHDMEAVAERTLGGRDPAPSVEIGEPTATGA